jgi:hypothetical protein
VTWIAIALIVLARCPSSFSGSSGDPRAGGGGPRPDPGVGREFSVGQTVWVSGREAIFCYPRRGGAIIRYRGEQAARVVPLHKVANAPPETP